MTRKQKRAHITLARPRTEKTDVASPTVPGKTDYVDRVVDLLSQIYNRHGISQIQFAAGERYRNAFEMLSASAGGAGDFDRVRGAGTSDGLGVSYVQAAQFVSDARMKILYSRDHAVLHRVCVEGKTFDRVAKELSASDLGIQFDEKEVSFMFKSALSQLAAAWWPTKVPKIDQGMLDHLAGDEGDAGDDPQFLEYGTPDWNRHQQVLALKGAKPMVPKMIKYGKNDVAGAIVRADRPRITAHVTQKSTAGQAGSISAAAPVAHAAPGRGGAGRVFWSNRGGGTKVK